MAVVDVATSCRVGSGTGVKVNDRVHVSMAIKNNLPWPLKKSEFHLVNITGPAHLEPAGSTAPKKVAGPDVIAPQGTAVQEFILKADDAGSATADMEFKCLLGDTPLSFPVTGSVTFTIKNAQF
jgi:hypothetical protein